MLNKCRFLKEIMFHNLFKTIIYNSEKKCPGNQHSLPIVIWFFPDVKQTHFVGFRPYSKCRFMHYPINITFAKFLK